MLDLNAFGERVKQLRAGRGMTQQDLGEQLGVSAQAVSKWENGLAAPDITLLPSLAATFSVSIDALLGTAPAAQTEDDSSSSTTTPLTRETFAELAADLRREILEGVREALAPWETNPSKRQESPSWEHSEGEPRSAAPAIARTWVRNRRYWNWPMRLRKHSSADVDATPGHCGECGATYDEDERHCVECHTNYGEDENHCVECHVNYGEDENHCVECHVNYGEDENHCVECHVNYGEDENHCMECHVNYGEDERHCMECHVNYGEDERHCMECHTNYDEDEKACPNCGTGSRDVRQSDQNISSSSTASLAPACPFCGARDSAACADEDVQRLKPQFVCAFEAAALQSTKLEEVLRKAKTGGYSVSFETRTGIPVILREAMGQDSSVERK